eukprot:GHRR01025747.1.p1 GENE.GHRR01025747.1~~GHRR01025747.1.p1  ORF type:complete len:161 (+),score=63.12 GHRR01025747.1:222-704(+)
MPLPVVLLPFTQWHEISPSARLHPTGKRACLCCTHACLLHLFALAALVQGGATGGSFQGRHTTDMGTGMQSILERNDLDELMALAELADRDFTAERYQPIVVGTSAHSALAAEQSAAARAETESRSAHKLHIPRRPPWDASTSAEQLDAQEKASFLNWRR